MDEIGDRATVIAGTGTYSTEHSMHLTERAHELGVHGFLIMTPYYNKPPARGIVEHFKAVAAVTDRPVVVYNIPARVVLNIEPETMSLLAEIGNVTAVKQANADLDAGAAHPRPRTRAVCRRRRPRAAVPRARRRRVASASTRTSSARR